MRVIASVALDKKAPIALRIACFDAALASSGKWVSDVILAALPDEEAQVRARVAWAVGERPPSGDAALTTELSREFCAEKDAPVRLALARALARGGFVEGRAALVVGLDPEQLSARGLAIYLDKEPAAVVEETQKTLERLSGFKLGTDHVKWTQWLALQPIADSVCGKRRGPDILQRFASVYSSPRLGSRIAGARALLHMGDARGALELAHALDPTDADMRGALSREKGIQVERLRPEIGALLELATGESFGENMRAWCAWLEAKAQGEADAAANAQK
jgi:hypothetical protein